jgi:5-methylthioribose kinase
MWEIDAKTAEEYLRAAGRLRADTRASIRELAGGVSNLVLRVEVEGERPFVIKQSRERLRVAMDWRAGVERIWKERTALEVLGALLPEENVPRVLFVDRERYLFAMTCAPEGCVTWKQRLMEGETDETVAREVGRLLGLIHEGAREHAALAGELSDRTLFDQLRVDPYYRTTRQAHPDLASVFDELIAAMEAVGEGERTLVLGDYSPKNILVAPGAAPLLLDFECAHAGDPAFDLGFCLNHLVLKAFHRAIDRAASETDWARYLELVDRFWEGYEEASKSGRGSERGRRAAGHLAGCALARVDGKSPVEYLGERARGEVRAFARGALRSRERGWKALLGMVRGRLG